MSNFQHIISGPLRVHDLYRKLGSKPILDGINLTLESGAISMLMGPSGCGKTTLLRCLSFLDCPTSGEISFGKNIFRFSPNAPSPIHGQLYPAITLVFQQLFLWPHLTNRENILLASENSRISSTFTDQVCKALNLDPFLDNYPNQSSLGQKQRIALARSVVLQPSYLLLDEITSALDSESVNQVGRLLHILIDMNTTILCVTHDARFATAYANKVFYMEHGKIHEHE